MSYYGGKHLLHPDISCKMVHDGIVAFEYLWCGLTHTHQPRLTPIVPIDSIEETLGAFLGGILASCYLAIVSTFFILLALCLLTHICALLSTFTLILALFLEPVFLAIGNLAILTVYLFALDFFMLIFLIVSQATLGFLVAAFAVPLLEATLGITAFISTFIVISVAGMLKLSLEFLSDLNRPISHGLKFTVGLITELTFGLIHQLGALVQNLAALTDNTPFSAIFKALLRITPEYKPKEFTCALDKTHVMQKPVYFAEEPGIAFEEKTLLDWIAKKQVELYKTHQTLRHPITGKPIKLRPPKFYKRPELKGQECPITLAKMRNPVYIEGQNRDQCFSSKAIRRWYQQSGTNPLTNLPIQQPTLVTNKPLQHKINSWRGKRVKV